MKHIYIIILLLPALLYGQKTAQWETKFYFEDAAGNRDTITVGYDDEANYKYNPDFGEVDIKDVPWDSVFEVRAGHGDAGVHLEEVLSKKIIGGIKKQNPDSDGCRPSELLRMFVRVKHLPLTITWDSTNYNNVCHDGNYIAPHDLDGIFSNLWFTDTIGFPVLPPYFCLSSQSAYVLNSIRNELYDWFNAYIVVENADGTLDSLYALNLHPPAKNHPSTPCKSTVAVEEISPDHTDIKVYPNPGQTTVYLGYTDRLRWELTDTQGKKIAIGSDPWLEIGELPQGVYFLNIHISDRVITKKVVKSD
jgi:hypothetical protein